MIIHVGAFILFLLICKTYLYLFAIYFISILNSFLIKNICMAIDKLLIFLIFFNHLKR